MPLPPINSKLAKKERGRGRERRRWLEMRRERKVGKEKEREDAKEMDKLKEENISPFQYFSVPHRFLQDSQDS